MVYSHQEFLGHHRNQLTKAMCVSIFTWTQEKSVSGFLMLTLGREDKRKKEKWWRQRQKGKEPNLTSSKHVSNCFLSSWRKTIYIHMTQIFQKYISFVQTSLTKNLNQFSDILVQNNEMLSLLIQPNNGGLFFCLFVFVFYNMKCMRFLRMLMFICARGFVMSLMCRPVSLQIQVC